MIEKERISEEKWFSENEEKLLKEAKVRHQKKLEEQQQEEKIKLKELHWLKCPKCGHDMKVITIEGIEIDQCENCDGVFFDAGELDDLLLKETDKRKSIFRSIVAPLFDK